MYASNTTGLFPITNLQHKLIICKDFQANYKANA